jgi:prefoldin subunit 5
MALPELGISLSTVELDLEEAHRHLSKAIRNLEGSGLNVTQRHLVKLAQQVRDAQDRLHEMGKHM